MRDGDMLEMLRRAEMALIGPARYGEVSALLADDGWNTLDVNYEPPRVERLWKDFEDGRLYLHRIYPCEKALYHPHPWPSAVKIVTGSYEMAVGYQTRVPTGGSQPEPPPFASLQVLTKGSTYEMIRPDGWHYVKPLGGTSYSIMVTGPKWEGVWSPKANHKLEPVKPEAKLEILKAFQAFYGL